MRHHHCRSLFALTGLFALSLASRTEAQLVATYQFNNTLSADQSGAPALTPINSGAFVSDSNVLGQSRTVYQRTSNSNVSSQQSALRLDTSSLSLTANSYAVDMVFTFTDSLNPGGYRRIVDSYDPSSLIDPGFYVGPQNTLNIYQGGQHAGGPALTDGTYYHVVLSVSPTGERAYLNGSLAVNYTGGTPDAIQTHYLNFFQDEVYEYGNGKIGLLRVFNRPLTDDEVVHLYNNGDPFPGTVPAPSSLVTLLFGIIPGAAAILRRQK